MKCTGCCGLGTITLLTSVPETCTLCGGSGESNLVIDCDIQPKETDMYLVIDCHAQPKETDGYTVRSHQDRGLVPWNPDRFNLYPAAGNIRKLLSDKQLRNKQVNINVLDWLLAHPENIPDSWPKDESIHFFGTLFNGPNQTIVAYYLTYFLGSNKHCWRKFPRDVGARNSLYNSSINHPVILFI